MITNNHLTNYHLTALIFQVNVILMIDIDHV